MLWKLIETNGTTHNNTQLKLRLPWVQVSSTPNMYWLIAAARLIVEYAGAEWVEPKQAVTAQDDLGRFRRAGGHVLALPLDMFSVATVRRMLEA